MTTHERFDSLPRFEHELRDAMRAAAGATRPDYLNDALLRTVAARQRPTWSFPGRWFPMVDIARQPVLAPRLPWRSIALVLALIALLLAAAWTLLAGAQRRIPAPYGKAGNGLIAFASGGDIYTADPAAGSSKAIIRGPETDLNPRWSRDGTRLAFERKVAGDAGPGVLYVAHADGSGLTRVTQEPLAVITDYAFSPDGRELLVSAEDPYQTTLVAAVDGSAVREIAEGMPATNASWRPTDGGEILFMGAGDWSDGYGSMRVVGREGGTSRILPNAATGCCKGHARWSPDGSMISYVDWDAADGLTARTHVMAADGSWDRVLPLPRGAVWQGAHAWSNDGTRLLAIRGYTDLFEAAVPAVIPVDGRGTGTDIEAPGVANGSCCSAWEWAPDDSLILGTPTDSSGAFIDQVMLDPVAGTSRTVPWRSVSLPSWQRLAP
jgi:dipeptidyl aminopeptidase/acylaminoacyl peptidase